MSKAELATAYNPQEHEQLIYTTWEQAGFFNPDNLPLEHTEPFAIMMPPPNVTGVLHLGHALENALMDTMARFQRLRGKKVLLLPGTDHAAVATQARVEKNLIESGKHTNPRQELGREKLLEVIREYAENSKSHIITQIKRMGTSCDWDRLAYTFDEQRSQAVTTLFKKMYDDGLIYRGYRVVNWSVTGQSTCSDDELEYTERTAKMYTFKYSKDFPITIASTRPETKLGDTAVAVHPSDPRYQQYVGKTFTVDVGAQKPLTIKVIADPHVDRLLGTGALGVTPAHSHIDYELYESRKGTADEIALTQVIGEDGCMTEAAGSEYAGLTVEAAREKFVHYLRDNDLLEQEEEITQNVGTSDRFGDIVEVVPMTQWFVAVNKDIPGRNKTLKDLLREAVTTGHKGDNNQKVAITPDRFEKIYLHWIDNLRDWCISRQIWWGHRIPAWYPPQNSSTQTDSQPEIYVGTQPPADTWKQDADTLDTWFSSGAWTFSTLGWPAQTKDLTDFHPTQWMQMGHELVFFWMARMILMSTYALDQLPFHNVYIHGLLRDEHGRKFSKSLKNGIDPIELSDKYGTDALRMSLLIGISPGNDSKFYEEKVEHWRNTINKFWNIARYILMNVTEIKRIPNQPPAQTLADEWILAEFDQLITDTTEHFANYQFSLAGEKLYEFTWSKLADWYIEIAKVEKNKDEILLFILEKLLILWHPFTPFVTETIWKQFETNELLMVQAWPSTMHSQTIPATFTKIQTIITSLRNARAQAKAPPGKVIPATITTQDSTELVTNNQAIIEQLARVNLTISNQPYTGQHISCIEHDYELYIPVTDTVKQALDTVKQSLQNYIAALEKKLANEQFVAKAPKEVVTQEQQKLTEAQEKIAKMV